MFPRLQMVYSRLIAFLLLLPSRVASVPPGSQPAPEASPLVYSQLLTRRATFLPSPADSMCPILRRRGAAAVHVLVPQHDNRLSPPRHLPLSHI